MNVMKCLKTSAVFVGTMIGAGFATGREILIFFGKSSPVIPVLSAVICGLFCYLFLKAGHHGLNVIPYKGKRIMLGSFYLAAFIVFAAMIAASEEVIYEIFAINGGGVITAIIIGIICLAFIDGLKLLNLIVVPLIILFVALLFFKTDFPALRTKLNFPNAFAYVALNMFLGGFLIVPDGKSMKKNEMIMTAVITAILLSVMIFMIYVIVLKAGDALMPVVEVARSLNLHIIASILIYLAVITTMAGCFTALTAITMVYIKDKWTAGAAVSIVGILAAIIGFKLIVDIGYPLVSIIGSVYTVSVIVTVIRGGNRKMTLLSCRCGK